MKQCPICKRIYGDDTLRFCLEDGTMLARQDRSSVATLTMPVQQNLGEPPVTLAYEAEMSPRPTAASEARSYKRWVIIGAVLLAATIGLVSAVSWFRWSATHSTSRQFQTAGGSRLATEFRLGDSVPSDGLTEMTVRDSGEKVYLQSQPILTSEHVASATVGTLQDGASQYYVMIELTDVGREILAQVTASHINKRLGIVVGRELLCAPTIVNSIPGGKVSISGRFTELEARRLAEDIMGK